MRPPLADVGVRTRGLATHLLPEETLRRLARCSGSGVLAGALQAEGYWPAPSAGRPAASAVAANEAAIEHEVQRRLRLVDRWLGERRRHFVGVFGSEERRALRFWLRRLRLPGRPAVPPVAPGAGWLPRRLRDELSAASDAASFVRALRRAGSPWAGPLGSALQDAERDPRALERALDGAFAAHSLRAAAGLGGRLRAWVEEGIDLENAWDALSGGGGFLQGGRRPTREEHASVAADPDAVSRRDRLARILADGPLARAFGDPWLPDAALEARARSVRIEHERRAARIDPLGASPILEFVMRLWAERVELRRINWGIAQARPPGLIAGQMAGRG